MKRKLLSLFLSLFSALFLFCAVACNQSAEAKATLTVDDKVENVIVIRIDEIKGDAKLSHALEALKADGALTYEISDGMIVSVNGKANNTLSANEGYSWMIYTSDTELSYEEYTMEYESVTYYSAAYGAENLTLKTGEYYVLSYEYWGYWG